MALPALRPWIGHMSSWAMMGLPDTTWIPKSSDFSSMQNSRRLPRKKRIIIISLLYFLWFPPSHFKMYIWTYIVYSRKRHIYSDILSEIHGILSGSLSEIYSDILSGILSDIHSDMVSGIYSYLTYILTCYPAFFLIYTLAFNLS